MNEITKDKNYKLPHGHNAVGLKHWLGAFLNNEQRNIEIKVCKNCIHSVDISGNKNSGVYWCNRKHKIDIVTGEPELTPCYHERQNSLSKCGEKAKYFISKQKEQETNNKNMENGK